MKFARKREEPKRRFYLCPDYGNPESCRVFMFADDPMVKRAEAFAVDSSGLVQTRISHYWPQVKKTTDTPANLKGKAVDKDPFVDNADEGQDEHISSCPPCPKPVNRAQLSNPFTPTPNNFVTSSQEPLSSTLPVRPRHAGNGRTPADADPDIQLHRETSRLARRHCSGMIAPPTHSAIPALNPEAIAECDFSDEDIWKDEDFTAGMLAIVKEAETSRGNLKGPQLRSNEPPQTPRSAIQPKQSPRTPENILPPPSSTPGSTSRGGFVVAMEQEGSAAKRRKHHHEDTSFKGTQANFIAPTPLRTPPDALSCTDSEHFSDSAEAQHDNEDDRMDIQEDYSEEEQSDESGEGKEEQEEEEEYDEDCYCEVGHEHVQHEDQSTCEAPSTPSRRVSNAPTTISNGLATPITSRNRDGRYKNVRTGRVPFSGASRNPPQSSSPSVEPPPPLEDAIMDDIEEILGASGEPVSPDTLRKLRLRVAERAAPVIKELAMARKSYRRLRAAREDAKLRLMEVWSCM